MKKTASASVGAGVTSTSTPTKHRRPLSGWLATRTVPRSEAVACSSAHAASFSRRLYHAGGEARPPTPAAASAASSMDLKPPRSGITSPSMSW
eukprot:2998687-Prymnesium_polylepis.1